MRFVVAVGLVALAACSKQNDVSQTNNAYDDLPTVVVNADGGELAGDHGMSVEVPPGAVEQETTVAGGSVDASKAPALPTDVAALGLVFALEPHGLTFKKPVTINIPFATQGAAMKLYTAPTGGAWTAVDGAALQGTTMRAQVTHFSYFIVVSQDPCFAGGKNAPDGTTCGTDKVCKAGACITCAAGGSCALGQGECKAGVLSCATGAPLCVPGAKNLDDGTQCGTHLFCVGGTCKACNDGDTCTAPGAVCKVAKISCATGSAACEAQPGDIANGTSCGADQVCFDGLCAGCTADKSCTGANPCKVAKTSCASGQELCIETSADVPAGTSCGAGHVCLAGSCQSCDEGAACTDGAAPCKLGAIVCNTGSPVCHATTANQTDGTACGAGKVCLAGACNTCDEGASCAPSGAPCKTGRISCASGAPVCQAQAADIPNGTTCGTNQVCFNGSCSSCTAGKACSSANPCKEARTTCGSGLEICAETGVDVAAGASCGTGKVCLAGACNACEEGAACVDASAACKTGAIACSTGSPVCRATTTNVGDGTACGVGKVCLAGACNTCDEGVACAPADAPCKTGKTSCSTGTSVCQAQATDIANGTACGTDKVCFNGACSACVAGNACTSANPCHEAKTVCSSGQEICTETGADVAAGTSCGSKLVCLAGSCNACDAGASCVEPASPCKAAAIACGTGSPVCQASTTNLPNGTSCGANLVCGGGACNACTAGASCVLAASPCAVAAVVCTSGASVCTDQGTLLPDGTACGTGMACNATGQCIVRDGTLTATAGAGGGAMINQTVPTVTLKLAALDSTPIANRVVTVVAPAGAVASPTQATTNSSGVVAFSLRVGRVPGDYKFTFAATGAPAIEVTETATEPPAGTVIPVVNAAGSTGAYKTATAAIGAPVGSLLPVIAVARDGAFYVVVATSNLIYQVKPDGTWNHVGGDPAVSAPSTNAGNGGSAKAATFYGIKSIAIDDVADRLYVACGSAGSWQVRGVDLGLGTVDRYAGLGTQTNGDGGPATDATFATLMQVSVGIDGTVYVLDGYAVRAIDPVSTVITTAIANVSTAVLPSGTFTGAWGLPSFETYGDATFVGDCNSAPCLLRKVGATYTVTAGRGTTVPPASGAVTALKANLVSFRQSTLDPAGNAFMLLPGYGIAVADLVTSRVTRVLGDLATASSTGDYGAATAAKSNANAMGIDAAGNLYVVETAKARMVWKAGQTSPTVVSVEKTSGDGGNAMATDFAAPLVATIRDAGGGALSNVPLRWAATDGSVVTSAGESNASGVVATTMEVGVDIGPYVVDAQIFDLYGRPVASTKQTFTVTATAPAAGTLTATYNVGGSATYAGIPGPALGASVATFYGLTFAPDGTYFVARANRILRVSKSGYQTLLAGTGGTGAAAGDGGPAVAAVIDPCGEMAYDPTRDRLYFAQAGENTIRAVNLASGTIELIAGGGSAAGPGYGDGGSATAAAIGSWTYSALPALAVGPDGAVYIRHNLRIRRIDPVAGSINAWFTPSTYTSATLSLDCTSSPGLNVGPAFDAAGNAYFIAAAYGVGLGAPVDNSKGYCTNVIARLGTDGTLTRLAGKYGGAITAVDVTALDVGIDPLSYLAVSPSGEVAYAPNNRSFIRRIDPVTGNMVAVAGNGTSGAPTLLGPAISSLIGAPTPGLSFDPAGRINFVDQDTLRALRVW